MTSPHSYRLILLPGLGADKGLFGPQRRMFPHLEVPPWLPHHEGETLAEYAKRMSTTLDVAEPFCIGGASFGGMVAQELARHLNPAAVFLIASGRSGDCVAPHLRYFGEFAKVLPTRVFEVGQGLSRLFVEKFGQLTASQRSQFEAMLSGARPDFVRWGVRAILSWPGAGDLPMPVYHIHGQEDQLIPLDKVQPEEVVPRAGHLVNITHSAVVNRFIADRIPR
ncbi:MAG: alpha/beta hydrolase [Rhodospirillales bacterium]|nr:alpha/beta hydrolase [Rhodospirillales bacterium]